MQENQKNCNQKQRKQTIQNQCRKYVPYFVVIIGIVLTGVVYLISMENTMMGEGIELGTEFCSTQQTSETAQEEPVIETTEIQNNVTVYVCGAVIHPDVYTLPEGSRLVDAIHAAGGFKEDAWREGINLARTIVDAEQIYVPTQEEHLSGMYPSTDVGAKEENSNSGKVNLNTATKEQLMSLPGIGESKAESIIAYRQQNGAFSSIEDIMKISGIKESVFNKIKEQITI